MAGRLLLDHVVVRVFDLAAASRDFTELGFTVVAGGAHPGLGSQNALVAFADDTYLELIAFKEISAQPEEPVSRPTRARKLAALGYSALECRFLPWESSAEGLVDYALVPVQAEDAIRQARARGVSVEGPIPGERMRLDGQRVSWQLGVPDGFDLPFLCADVTPRSLRVPGGEARRHANGATGIARLAVAVRDLDAGLARYRAWLGGDMERDFSLTFPEARAVNFLLGPAAITLLDIRADATSSLPHFSRSEEGPCALWLATNTPTAIGRLDPEKSHGAWIELTADG